MLLFVIVAMFEDYCNSRAAGSTLFGCIVFFYQLGFLTYKEGITFGKYSRNIQPVSALGQPLTQSQKIVRALVLSLPYFFIGAERSLVFGAELVTQNALVLAPLIGICLLFADLYPLEFHKQPRTLTDRIARTIVVSTPPPQPHRAPAFPMYSRNDAEFGMPPSETSRRNSMFLKHPVQQATELIGNFWRSKPPLPNITVKRTPTKPMASPFSWVLLVPSTRCAPSAPLTLGYKGFPICQAKPSPGDSPKAIHLEPANHQTPTQGSVAQRSTKG